MHWLSNTAGSVSKDTAATSLPDIDAQGVDEASTGYRAALAAALSLLPHVGAGDDPVVVTIAGYSYAGHDPGSEPNEVITITVGARPEDKPAPEPAPVEVAATPDA